MKRLGNIWGPIVIIVITFILFLTNYIPGTFLIGWDNLFPELNFRQDFLKNFSAVWQEYRGLGLLDGMSHAANLVHDVERLLISFILPLNMIRWAYILLMFLLGGLGMYTLLAYDILQIKLRFSRIVSLFGALFYQYNLATIQQFYLPFEVFVVHFAFLPWLLFTARKFLFEGSKRALFVFLFFSIISIPQAHVPTLFIVYVIALAIVSAFTILFSSNKSALFKRFAVIIALTGTINAFWVLPFIYSTLANSSVIENSKNFEMSSNDIFYRNLKYGDFSSVALLKGFSLDFHHFDYKTGSYKPMMAPWLTHIQTPRFKFLALAFFVIAAVGSLFAMKRRERTVLPFLFIFTIGFMLIGTNIPILRGLTEYFRNNIPLFATVFRFTFTKFSFFYTLGYSILLAYGLLSLLGLIRGKLFRYALIVFLFGFLTYYSLPAFRGYFFYKNLAVQIPKEYFEVFSFMKNQNADSRIAILPIPWYWAWLQPTWGTINSGFIWYGISQPITDIAFTPWSDKNENFYWELEQAIYSEDTTGLVNVLSKYDINWIYLDKNILHDAVRRMTSERYEDIIEKLPNIEKKASFGNINLYQIRKPSLTNFVSIKPLPINVLPIYRYDNIDRAYQQYGTYVSSERFNKYPSVYFPYRTLFSNKNQINKEFQIEETDQTLIFKSLIPRTYGLSDTKLVIPKTNEHSPIITPIGTNSFNISYKQPVLEGDTAQFTEVSALLEETYNSRSPNFRELRFYVPKEASMVYGSYNNETFLDQKNDACELNTLGMARLEKVYIPGKSFAGLRLTSRGTKNCIKASLPNLSHNSSYLMRLEVSSDKTRGFLVNLYNETWKKTDMEVYLPNDGRNGIYYLIVPPRQTDGIGYTLYLNNNSEGSEIVTNTIYNIEIYQIPFNILKNIKLQRVGNETNDTSISRIGSVEHPNPSLYIVSLKNKRENNAALLYLSQSYHNGWRAYDVQCQMPGAKCQIKKLFPFIFGKEIKEHILVNNWANGWVIQSDQSDQFTNKTIILFFLPQLLEWIGFAMLPLAFLLAFKSY